MSEQPLKPPPKVPVPQDPELQAFTVPEMRKEDRPPAIRRTAVALAILFVVDLGFLGQGLLSILVAAVGLGLLTVGALWAAARSPAPRLFARSRAMRAGLYVLLAIAAIAAMQFHTATAEN